MKKDKHVLYQLKDIPLRNLPWFEDDTKVTIYEDKINHALRVVRSEKKNNREEPWYLLTNDFKSTKDKVIADYYFRFKIEETFKDLKHIFELKSFYRIQKKQTFLTLLWFYILGIWLSFLLPHVLTHMSQRILTNLHQRLSLPRLSFESLLLEKHILVTKHLCKYSYG